MVPHPLNYGNIWNLFKKFKILSFFGLNFSGYNKIDNNTFKLEYEDHVFYI